MLFPFILMAALTHGTALAVPYRAVVVDASTSQPLAGVAVQDLDGQKGLLTDAAGRFTLPGLTAHFRLQCLGYAPLETTRSGNAAGQLDTLRLLPLSFVLPEVHVRPSLPVTLSSIGRKRGGDPGILVVPGQQSGVLFRPAPGSPPVVVEQLVVRWQPNHPTAGRVRVRLVAVQPDSLRTPSPHDLVPVAALFTAAQLSALPDQTLTLDLTAYGLRLPPEGLYVLVEGLPTDPRESAVAMAKDDPTPWQIITATDPQNPATHHRTPANEFPAVRQAESITTVRTVGRQCCNRPWRLSQTGNPRKAANVDCSLIVRPE